MTWQQVITDHWEKMSRLKVWAGTLGMQALEDHHSEQMKNIAAENQANRAMYPQANQTTVDDEMRQTVLGDYNITQVPQQSSSLGPLILGAGLLAVGAGLPIAAYLASQSKPVTPVEQPANNTTINQGLDEDTTIQLTLPEWSE